jgi:hypothetical protein
VGYSEGILFHEPMKAHDLGTSASAFHFGDLERTQPYVSRPQRGPGRGKLYENVVFLKAILEFHSMNPWDPTIEEHLLRLFHFGDLERTQQCVSRPPEGGCTR